MQRDKPDCVGGRVQDVSVGAPVSTQDFDAFFRLEYPKLVAIATAMTGGYDIACELAQEALLRSYRSWDRVSNLDIPGAWVRRVLINLAIDARRSDRRATRSPSLMDHDNTTSLDDLAVDGWWTAVRALPDRQRAVVVLHYVEDRSVLDVARLLGIAEGTVKATLAKARQTLARTLEKEA